MVRETTCSYKNKTSKNFGRKLGNERKKMFKNSCFIKKEKNLKSITQTFALFYKNIFDDDSVTVLVVSPKKTLFGKKMYIYLSHVTVSNTISVIRKLN